MGANCCVKRSKDTITDVANKGVIASFPPEESTKLNQFIGTFFKENRDSNFIILSLPKDQFKNFMNQISKTVAIMKGLTGKLFIPTFVSNCPVTPERDMIICMRNTEDINIPGISVKGGISES